MGTEWRSAFKAGSGVTHMHRAHCTETGANIVAAVVVASHHVTAGQGGGRDRVPTALPHMQSSRSISKHQVPARFATFRCRQRRQLPEHLARDGDGSAPDGVMLKEADRAPTALPHMQSSRKSAN